MDDNHPLYQFVEDEPTPFPNSFPQLSRLDRTIVCPICKDCFKGPVSISCGHSFCSACIRSYFDVSKKCPTCHEVAKEGSIRRNRILEEMTDAWEAARPLLLDLTQPPRKRPASPSRGASSSSSSKRTRQREVDSKTHIDNTAELVRDSSDSEEVLELGEKDEVPCPICNLRMPIATIPGHIDRGCPPPKFSASSGNQKADWKKVFAGTGSGKNKILEMKRIIKPNYSLIGITDLRSLLNEYGLPTTGDRAVLESRFQEWIVLYNANLDTSHPHSLPALRAQLASSELSRKRDKDKGKEEAINALKTKDGLNRHAQQQRSEFERLRDDILSRNSKRKGIAEDSPIEVE